MGRLDQACQTGAWPRPLSQRGHTGLINIHNDDREALHLSRPDTLIHVKDDVTYRLPGAFIEQPQACCQHHGDAHSERTALSTDTPHTQMVNPLTPRAERPGG